MDKEDIDLYGYAYFVKFLDYFMKKNILFKTFKMKHFIKDDSYNCIGGHRRYCDIDMSIGMVRYAFAFGHKRGYIVDVSNNLRKFDLVHLRADGFI